MAQRGQLYSNLWEAFKRVYPTRAKDKLQADLNEEWKEIKKNATDDSALESAVQTKIEFLLRKSTKEKSTNILSFFKKGNTSSVRPDGNHPTATTSRKVPATLSSSAPLPQPHIYTVTSEHRDTETTTDSDATSRSTPSQDDSKKRIASLQTKITNLVGVRDIGFANNDAERQIKKFKKDLSIEEAALKKKQSDAERKKKSREKQRIKLKGLCEKYPDVKKDLKFRDGVIGRPRIEVDQPDILQAIIDIATFGGAADDRRRTEMIRSCKTLTELTKALEAEGFSINKSTVHLRLIPRRWNTEEGKRHVKTVPVKLSRPEADSHAKHPDGHFCHATIRALETLAPVLGPEETIFFAQDDKSRIPLGLTAAKRQSPMLMHLEYRVTLPDHDWVVAERHKLIPSVYAGIVIEPNTEGRPESVSYSGPTYIAIRSGKHCSSTAETHAGDLEHLLELQSFQSLTKTSEGMIKPVMVITVDGGPDENPRYARVIACAIQHFKNFDLDALYVATNAPGRSAYNRVERRMAPLSNQLTGVILPYNHFGSHLDSRNKTVDKDLELKNFAHAGEILAEIWSSLVIDSHPVVAEYVSPRENKTRSIPDASWCYKHVRESQYCLQIVKCENEECCGIRRSSLWRILKSGFLPRPAPIVQTASGLHMPSNEEKLTTFAPILLRLAIDLQPELKGFKQIPYDMYCLSVQSHLADRSCKECGAYHASIQSAKAHYKELHKKETRRRKVKPAKVIANMKAELLCVVKDLKTEAEDVEWIQTEDTDCDTMALDVLSEEDTMPIIGSLTAWLTNPWTEKT